MISFKIVKYLRNNFNHYLKDLCIENYDTLSKEFKENVCKWKDITYLN